MPWDSRLEALVVDAVVRGDSGPELLSRAAALSWESDALATVIVGLPAGAECIGSVVDSSDRQGVQPVRTVGGAGAVAGDDRQRLAESDRTVRYRAAGSILPMSRW